MKTLTKTEYETMKANYMDSINQEHGYLLHGLGLSGDVDVDNSIAFESTYEKLWGCILQQIINAGVKFWFEVVVRVDNAQPVVRYYLEEKYQEHACHRIQQEHYPEGGYLTISASMCDPQSCFIAESGDEMRTIFQAIELLRQCNITGEQIQYIVGAVGMTEQLTKQLINESSIKHRMDMILDDVNKIIPLVNDELVFGCLHNIEIACDLESDECLDWIKYEEGK